MRKTRKQIFKGHKTHIKPSLMAFFFSLSFFFSRLYYFDFTNFYILVLSKYLRNINWEVLRLAELGKPRLPRNF